MTPNLPERDLLRWIDPAPTDVHDDDRLRNLRAVLERVTSPRPRRRRSPRGGLRFTLPLAGALAATAVALPLWLPTAVAPETSTPIAESSHAAALRVGTDSADGTRIIARATVGSAVFLLGRRADDVRLGASFDGSDPGENWETFGEPVAPARDTITVVNPSNFPDIGPNGTATVTGLVGDDVSGVEIRTHDGQRVRAVVADGFYLAAWAGTDFADVDTLDPSFMLHLTDGTTRTLPYADASSD